MPGPRKILVFSPPFSGHLNVIKSFIAQNSELTFRVIITGWKNIPADIDENILDVTKLAKSDLHETDPGVWTLPRTVALLDKCITIAEEFKPDIILYDFFSLEGYFTGKLCGIQAWSSIPALIGPFVQESYLKRKLADAGNVQALNILEDRYGLHVSPDDIELVSDGLHIPGDVNLVWSYQSVVQPDFLRNRQGKPYLFLGNPHDTDKQQVTKHRRTHPTILISFGTVVMGNLWNNQREIKEGLRSVIKELVVQWADAPFRVIFVTQGRHVLDEYPANWSVRDTVNQVDVLRTVDVFITHCGSNSFHESLVACIPMVGVPFFGDQPLVAQTIERLHFGVNLVPSAHIDTHNAKDYLNANLAHELDSAVRHILQNDAYVTSLHELDRSRTHRQDLLSGTIPFEEGDLLFGTNIARKKYVDENGLQSEFTILEFKAFSEIAPKKSSLPRIVDIYHDAILNDSFFLKDIGAGMDIYAKHLHEYKLYLAGETEFEKMCIKGIDFFTRYYRIHFILDDYDPALNRVTFAEIEHILSDQHRLGDRVTFYIRSGGVWVPVSFDWVRTLQRTH